MSFGARFGAIVRERRGIEGLSIADLAVRAFDDAGRKGDISRIENGKVPNPQAKTVDALAVALNILPEEVLICRGILVPTDMPSRLLRLLARRFGERNPNRPEAVLVEFLESCAVEYTLLKERLAALSSTDDRIADFLLRAQDAVDRGDFGHARALLVDAEDVQQTYKTLKEIEAQANLREQRARIGLLAGRSADAATDFRTAALMFQHFALPTTIERLQDYSRSLQSYGKQSDIVASLAARDLLELAASIAQHDGDKVSIAANLASCTIELATCAERAEALALLDEAVKFIDEASHVEDPGLAVGLAFQHGRVLKERAIHATGLEQQKLLSMAVERYRVALAAIRQADDPDSWAACNNNLASALRRLAYSSPAIDRNRLLRAAATAWGDVLQVRKREDNEVLWARASANVARAVSDLFHYLLMEDGGEITERVREAASYAIYLFVEVVDVMRGRAPNDYALTLQDIATIHANVRSYGSAIQLLEEAHEVFLETGNAAGIGTCEEMLGKIATAQARSG
ncbi:helix-turn-helix domain-containing protein [Ensifer sp. ENS05]|uniref:helix-turn-helix domain-containing protein n=1 Tax=Ensifer sp. ENS05 TaxID=2769277 RepID=UPI00177C728F|nr:helix-turn-helix transcriptional regulator [Ensifer sp. ENS05]MBD9596378.1 helix-turn-helix domain-containing protein [Ensifer sp. ENS05]